MHAGGAAGPAVPAASSLPSLAQLMDAVTHILFLAFLYGFAHTHGYRLVVVVLCLVAMTIAFNASRWITYTDPDAVVQKFLWLAAMAALGVVAFIFPTQDCSLCLKKGLPTAIAVENHVKEHVWCMNALVGSYGENTNMDWSWSLEGGREKKWVKCLTSFAPGWQDCDFQKVTEEALSCKTK